jgi:D-tyrosyl-tRNA(Tyr) deacylase
MRAVLQRVSHARVRVDAAVAGEIGPGLLVLLGVSGQDTAADVTYIATKIRELRIFPDEQGRMNRSVEDVRGAVLMVSQFTLYGDGRKGRRPSFDAAAPPDMANALYEDVIRELRGAGLPVETGVFQAHMLVELANDGPVTLLLDSTRMF